jgi:hypothetical protein
VGIPCFPMRSINFMLNFSAVGSTSTRSMSSVTIILFRALSMDAMNGNPAKSNSCPRTDVASKRAGSTATRPGFPARCSRISLES